MPGGSLRQPKWESTTVVEKKCRTCGQMLPISSFWFQCKRTGLLQSECKTCMRKRNSQWGREHRTEETIKKNNERTRVRRRRSPELEWFYGARRRARNAGIEFDLTLDDFVIPPKCPALGIPLKSSMGRRVSGIRIDSSPSMDRIDPKRGYIRDNCIVVSYRANRIKTDASLEEIKMVADFYEMEIARRSGDGCKSASSWEEFTDVSAMLALPT